MYSDHVVLNVFWKIITQNISLGSLLLVGKEGLICFRGSLNMGGYGKTGFWH